MAIISALQTTNAGVLRLCVGNRTAYYTEGMNYPYWEDYGGLGTNLFTRGERTINLSKGSATLTIKWIRESTIPDSGYKSSTIELIYKIGNQQIFDMAGDCIRYISFGLYDDGQFTYAILVTDYWIEGSTYHGFDEYIGRNQIWSGSSDTIKSDMHRWIGLSTISDPYEDDDDDPRGGGGDHNKQGDVIEIPDMPVSDVTDSKLITVYNPSLSQLQNFGNYLWSDEWDVEALKKIFQNPWEGIIGLSIVPVQPVAGQSRNIHLGNLDVPVSMPRVVQQFVDVNCGSVNIREYYGSYLDYSPYTSAEIYLPYVGTRPLDIDTIMKGTVSVKYRVDVISGACACYVLVDGSVMYQYSGSCSGQIPITAGNFGSVISGALSAGVSVAGTVASIASGGGNVAGAIGGISATASSVMGMKTHVEKGGSVAGVSGFLGVQKPYIILTYPNRCVPSNQNQFIGYPSYSNVLLSSIHGYNEIDTIHLENVAATSEELTEIESILKSGVIL